MQELDIRIADDSSRRGEAARETVLSSSRMLPGQGYVFSLASASGEKAFASSGRPFAAQYRAMNRFASTPISVGRSRSEGSRIENAFTR